MSFFEALVLCGLSMALLAPVLLFFHFFYPEDGGSRFLIFNMYVLGSCGISCHPQFSILLCYVWVWLCSL
jgi:hypothetical protein